MLLQVAHGELTEAPLETLSAVAQHVFLPLLTTSSNQEGWPDVVAKEVSENLHRFVANGAQCAIANVQPAVFELMYAGFTAITRNCIIVVFQPPEASCSARLYPSACFAPVHARLLSSFAIACAAMC